MENNQYSQQPINQQPINQQQIQSTRSLYQAAYVCMIITTVIFSFTIIMLAFMIPTTIATKRARDEVGTPAEVPHIALGVFALFCWIVPGILILVASGNAK